MTDVRCQVVVGREAELAVLAEALATARAGAGRAVFLTGEPGIGKSRLAREIADRAQSQGAMTAVGRAVPAGASTPYRPLTEALLQALRGRQLPASRDLAPWLPALGAIVPTLGGDPGTEPSTLTAAIRGEAVVRLLGALAGRDGLVIVLEDLHWADPDTLAVTEYLADNLGTQPVLCLATSRSEPPSAALDLIRRLHDRRAAVQLALERLSASEVADMIRTCLPDASEEVAARVRHTADGVPFLVEEVLASPGVPASFQDTVSARLAETGTDERAVLEAAAVLGRHFDWRLLGEVTSQPPDLISRALERGVSQLLLAVDGQEFRFRHALTRDAVAATLLPPRRAELAGAALAAVESAHPGLAGPWRDAAADLAAQAGDLERAGLLVTASGRDSLAAGALATAVDTLRRAATLLAGASEQAGASEPAGTGTLAGASGQAGAASRAPATGTALTAAETALVEALALAGRVDEASAVGARLIRLLGETEATARARAQVHLQLAHACVAATRWPAAASHLTQAAELLARSPDQALSGQAAVLAAEVALADDDIARARGLAAEALDSAGTGAEARCQAWELMGRSLRLQNLGAAEEAFEQALAEADRAGLPFWRLRALHELGTIEMFKNVPTQRLYQARQMADKLDAMSTAAVLDLQLAAVADTRFELDELARYAESSLAISERLGLDKVKAKALHFLVESRALRGDRDGCERYFALARAAAPGDPLIDALGLGGGRGMLALLSGDQAAAMLAYQLSSASLCRCRGGAAPTGRVVSRITGRSVVARRCSTTSVPRNHQAWLPVAGRGPVIASSALLILSLLIAPPRTAVLGWPPSSAGGGGRASGPGGAAKHAGDTTSSHRRHTMTLAAKNLDSPDQKRSFEHGDLNVVTLAGTTFARADFRPGFRWSTDIQPLAGTPSCEVAHIGVVLSGRFAVRMDDGTELEFGPGDAHAVGPGHDAWVIGDEPCVIIDIAPAPA